MFLAMFGEQTSQHKLAIFLEILKNFIEFWGDRRPLPNEKEKHLELNKLASLEAMLVWNSVQQLSDWGEV